MKIRESIRTMSYLKNNTEDVLTTVSENHTPMIITCDGEARMVVQDVDSYQEMKDSLNMLKLVAMGKDQIDKGETKPADAVFKAIEEKYGL